MLGERLRDCKDAAARAQSELGLRPSTGTSGEEMVELSQACGRDRALAMRQGRERRVEVRAQAEPGSDSGEAG